jgi:hypothetical protein
MAHSRPVVNAACTPVWPARTSSSRHPCCTHLRRTSEKYWSGLAGRRSPRDPVPAHAPLGSHGPLRRRERQRLELLLSITRTCPGVGCPEHSFSPCGAWHGWQSGHSRLPSARNHGNPRESAVISAPKPGRQSQLSACKCGSFATCALLDRTQEVAGSSPASSTQRTLQSAGFFAFRGHSPERPSCGWSTFGQPRTRRSSFERPVS